MDIQDQIASRMLRAFSPLLLWAAHWTLCYLVVAGLCLRGTWSAAAQPALLAVSLLALGALGSMLRHALRRLRGQPPQDLFDWAFAGSAVLALTGVAWTALPLLLTDGCR